jgi:eukaryotic-like serine/threonine-protein kinase
VVTKPIVRLILALRINVKHKAESTTTRIRANPARWQRLKDILAGALEQSSSKERTAMLKRLCAGDSTLLREAEKLLSYDASVFEEFAEFAASRLRQDERDRTGERLGAYAIVKELGRGGMGAVYLAERADGQFEKRVAIKILKRGTDTDEVLRRFRTERQILANLEHPNITRLLDAGTTTDGLPYFVMEFIEGTPITRFVQRANLDLQGRLKLFLKICSAVDLAHRHHIVHRDIKPTNVLVSQDGEPKLLDFGIAKLLSAESDDEITAAAEQRLTPLYASPEQTVGQQATISSDVYSLGALLYELLAGNPPNRGSNRDVSHNEVPGPQLPSEAITDRKTKIQIQGQLDRIVAKAMQRDATRRYSSAADLSQDIERYLSGAAMHSRKFSETASIRLGTKPWRRWSIAVAVLGVVVLAAGVLSYGPAARWLGKHGIGRVTPATSPSNVTDTIRSIAVLPFEPLGRDVDDELLGLGMADAVIGKLSALNQLVVLPTSAVSRYRGPANDPLAAGRALGVDAILSGTIQRSGDRVRATVQLTYVASGRAVWSEKFDQTFTDIFRLQDSISENVVRSLALNLTADERKQLEKRYTENAAAYDSYLMGLYFWNKRSKEGLEKAIDYFGRAVENDPKFALAYALMADCHYLLFYYRYDRRPDRIQNAKAAADRALLLDDSIAEAHVAVAMIQSYQAHQARDPQVAESARQAYMNSLRRALALNPNLPVAHQRYAWAICASGHLDEAVREMRRAQELDPLSHTNNTALGVTLLFARQYREALVYCYKAAELAPNEAPIQANLGEAYALNGMYQQAIEHYEKASTLDPEMRGDVLASIAAVLVSAGRKSEADSMMPEILKLAAEGKADPYTIAVLYCARGEKNRVFEWFDKSLQGGLSGRITGNAGMIRYDPLLDPLRSDSRFAALLRQHNMGSLLETPAIP